MFLFSHRYDQLTFYADFGTVVRPWVGIASCADNNIFVFVGDAQSIRSALLSGLTTRIGIWTFFIIRQTTAFRAKACYLLVAAHFCNRMARITCGAKLGGGCEVYV